MVCVVTQFITSRLNFKFQIRDRFNHLKPISYEWASQFTSEERQRLQDRYTLPPEFVRISFGTAQKQRGQH